MGRACNTDGEDGNAYSLLVGKQEKCPVGSPRLMWVENIKMYLGDSE
jgi:hypothetical protein